MIHLPVLIKMVQEGNLQSLKTILSRSKEYEYKDLSEDEFMTRVTERFNKQDGKTLLHYAAENNHLHIVNYLLSFNGVSIRHPDKNRNNFLCYLYLNGKMDALLPESIKEIKENYPFFNPVNRKTWMYAEISNEVLFEIFEDNSAESTKTSLLELCQQITIPDLPPANASAEEFKKNILTRLRIQIQDAALLARLSDSNQL